MSTRKHQHRAKQIFDQLANHYPPVKTFLTHKNTFELLIAVILSAQCTDERVNMVTPTLFNEFPTPESLANGSLSDIKTCIKSINFFNNKAKNIKATAHEIFTTYNGHVPDSLDSLITLPGVGRKTANVVLGQAFNIPGITVDTHVKRLSQRLKFTKHDDPTKIEQDLIKAWPTDIWIDMSSLLILHGRQICKARKPDCARCIIAMNCPSNQATIRISNH